MKKEAFDQQIERLRARWPIPFSDLGRIQRLADQFKFHEGEALEQAVTHLIGSMKYAPVDAEITGAVNRFSRKAPFSTPGRKPQCSQNFCDGRGNVTVWDLWGDDYKRPGDWITVVCCCEIGRAGNLPVNRDGKEALRFSRELVGPGKRWSLVRPLPVFKEAEGS